MKRLVLGLVFLGILSSSVYAKQVKVCTVTKSYTPSELVLACDGNWDSKITLKKMYKKGWRMVGSSMSGSGGAVIILEK